ETNMYNASDPRSTLSGGAQPTEAKWVHKSFFGSQLALFYGTDPQISDTSGQTWISRGKNFVIAYSKGLQDGVFARSEQIDEYAVIIPDAETQVEITTAAGAEIIPGYSIVFVPPGESSIRMLSPGTIIRLLTPRSKDMASAASNAEAFKDAHPNVPPFQPWPEPAGGLKLRWYTLDVPEDPSRFGRIYRCTTFMI